VLIRTKRFQPDYIYTQKFVGTLEADEVVMVDVGEDRQAFYRAAERYAKTCFSPLTLGGHVHSVDEAERLLELGADKVLVKWWRHDPITDLTEKYGRQVVMAGVDIPAAHSETEIWMAERAQHIGAGEILLTSVERDGSLEGYDLPTLQAVVAAVDVPVIVSGGCGSARHMQEAFETGAAGAVTTCIHHFPDGVLASFKNSLRDQGVQVRG
jgi:cyclase